LVLSGVTFFLELPNIDFHYTSPFSDWTFRKLSRFGIFMLAFTCHQNIFPLHNETRDNSIKAMTRLCVVCISLAYIMYIWYGLFSYFAFSELFFLNSGMGGSMFKYYSGTEIPFQIARILFAFLLAFSYPLQAFPFRLSLSRLLMNLPCMKSRSVNPDYLFIALSTGFIVLTFGIAMLQPNISNVLSLVGAVTSSVVCYILPSVIFLKLTMRAPRFFSRPNMTVTRVAASLLLVFGCLVFIICTVASISNFFK
jgi:amino acid permease